MESIMDLSVNELRTTPIKVDPLTPVSKAISILKELNAYELFVEKLGKIGIVTVRDLLSVKDISKTKVSSIMNFVPKLQPTTSLNVAAKIMMDYRIKALPILENNKLIGQITILSILKAIEDKIPKTIKLSSIMTKNPITLKENDSIAKARRMMIDKKIDHLPITFNGKVLGVLTSSDIVFIMVKP
ncbi:MAG: CBS domain-containing protein, partial [Candidatus Bathyarchaeia archaeon]